MKKPVRLNAAPYEAYWMKPDGEILPITQRHITDIVTKPELYGLTKAYVAKIYKKHKEPVASEGKAREDIMITLIANGWIRARYVRGNASWTFQVTGPDSFPGVRKLCSYLIKQGAGNYDQAVILDLAAFRLDNGDTNLAQVAAGILTEKRKRGTFAAFLNPGKKLLASSSSEEGIIKLISRYYAGSTIHLEGEQVHNRKGMIPGVAVVIVKGRYRFIEI